MNPVEQIRRDLSQALEATAEYALRAPHERYEATSDDGAVTAVVSGTRELVDIVFSPRATRDIDNHTLGEDVVEAVLAAERLATEAQQAALGHLTVNGRRIGDFSDPQAFVPRIEDLRR
ncbi:YbaB/EbfC family nucleoid-associated protein [Micromonospora sp. KC213]|uniref:YbaB/EbfC family nucleoid-associated protein n=1 Tax=Micromonospora sp. KC213 TaxID=2530378 RepID=UPI001050BAE9|nr:YbaB/EbfC family nucleoid-associated protein [Micromonospora sp. KC213]TDC41412.1 YbaB/EbfC family DNA-binding protein [Micromonospora sp. KC213]